MILSKDLYVQMILAGAENVIVNRDELDRINVFPVPDGDTGANLTALMSMIVSQASVAETFQHSAESISNAALQGARGNSGMIFSQFLISLNRTLATEKTITLDHFVSACEAAVEETFRSVHEPQEGTILTVMKDWVMSLRAVVNQGLVMEINQLIEATLHEAHLSLAKTKETIRMLTERDVVDAGAKGFLYFLEGMANVTSKTTEKLRRRASKQETAVSYDVEEHHFPKDQLILNRYCTEVLIEENEADAEIKQLVASHGDSVVIIADGSKKRIHLHTNHPDQVVRDLIDNGHKVMHQKVEDMQLQYNDQYNRRAKIAIVVDSACDLPAHYLEEHNVHIIPIHIEIDNNLYLDKATLKPAHFYELLDQAEKQPVTSQPSIVKVSNLYRQLLHHYDEVLSLTVSSQLSGTYRLCQTAAKQVDDERIKVIDSKNLSGTYGLLTKAAVEQIEKGATLQEVVENVEDRIKKTEIFVSVPTLKYMIKGGRVSPLKGAVARLLNAKPIVSLNSDGGSKLYGQTIFKSSNVAKLLAFVKKKHERHRVEQFVILHANAPELAEQCNLQVERITGRRAEYVTEVSPVIGAHAGKGAVSVAMLFEKINERDVKH